MTLYAERDELLRWLDELAELVAKHGRDDDVDVIESVRDCLVGWCGPHARFKGWREVET